MALPNVFTETGIKELITRINQLHENSQPLWGIMKLAQMLAHCNVTYEMIYTDTHKKPNFFIGWVLKTFVKSKVISETPYIKNGPTGPQFIVLREKKFEEEKKRLIGFIEKTQSLGEKHFNDLPSFSFGPLKSEEWNNMFYKHLDHHLRQFGV